MPATLQGGAAGPQASTLIGGVAVPVFVPLSDYPAAATVITAASGNQAAATATATLAAGGAGVTTYITGFEVTGSGATGALVVLVTVTNVVTGTLTYVYTAVAGITLANTPLIVQYARPIPANAANTTIIVSCPSLGTGNTNNAVVAHGYQL